MLDSGRYKGSLAKVFKNALNFIERNTRTGWRKTESGGREEVRAYPKEAIRVGISGMRLHIEIIPLPAHRLMLTSILTGLILCPRGHGYCQRAIIDIR